MGVLDIETFAHVVAHDLKAPLNGIASMIEFITEDYADRLDDEGREQLALVQSMATRSVAMVDALRHFARVSTVPLNVRSVDLAAVATQVASTVSRRHGDVQVTATVEPIAMPVAIDPAMAVGLLERLFDNAVRFSQQTHRHLTFSAAAADDAEGLGLVTFAVRDDGIGVAPKHRVEIFDMFKRLHGLDKFGGGVGAGLAIARVIVERHGGQIWVEPCADGGSSFQFTLPGATTDAAPRPVEA